MMSSHKADYGTGDVVSAISCPCVVQEVCGSGGYRYQ